MQPADGLALDLHVVQGLAGIDHRGVSGVGGHQGQSIAAVVNSLQCSFLADSYRSDLAVLHFGLGAAVWFAGSQRAGSG